MPDSTPRHTANLLDLDFHELPRNWPPPAPIVDIHSHIHGTEAVKCYRDVAAAYGITLTYSMTPLPEVEAVRNIMGDRIRFIATPEFIAALATALDTSVISLESNVTGTI